MDTEMKMDLKPFANESQTLSIGGLSVENRLDRVSLSGDIDLTKDAHGLAQARLLKAVVDATVSALEAEHSLPATLAPAEKPTAGRDPFA